MMINLESALHIDRFVQDTFHQGSDVFSDISRGRQCVANAFVSCVAAHISEKPASDWTSSNIDNVLLGGDALYCYTRKSVNSVYLEPCELPTYICMEGQSVMLKKHTLETEEFLSRGVVTSFALNLHCYIAWVTYNIKQL